MMTRTEASKALCPFMTKRLITTFNPHTQATITRHEQAPCRANACPMWEDERRENVTVCLGESRFISEHHRTFSDEGIALCQKEHGLTTCAGCPDFYGHCGGRR